MIKYYTDIDWVVAVVTKLYPTPNFIIYMYSSTCSGMIILTELL